MPFSHDIAGGQGNLIAASVQSPNFRLVPFQGWQINRDGTLYAANAVISGTITASVFQGTDFVINSAGSFYYSAAPGPGKLTATVTPAAGADDGHANPYLAGITAYFTSLGGITYALNMAAGGGFTPITWYVNSGSGFTAVADIASISATGLNIDSSASGPLTLNAGTSAIVLDSPVTANAGSAGSPTVISTDTWHPLTLLNSWANNPSFQAARCRLMPDNSVRVGAVINGNAATSGTFATMPYHPATASGAAVGCNTGAPAGTVPNLRWDTSGNLSVNNVAFPVAASFFISADIPLD